MTRRGCANYLGQQLVTALLSYTLNPLQFGTLPLVYRCQFYCCSALLLYRSHLHDEVCLYVLLVIAAGRDSREVETCL